MKNIISIISILLLVNTISIAQENTDYNVKWKCRVYKDTDTPTNCTLSCIVNIKEGYSMSGNSIDIRKNKNIEWTEDTLTIKPSSKTALGYTIIVTKRFKLKENITTTVSGKIHYREVFMGENTNDVYADSFNIIIKI